MHVNPSCFDSALAAHSEFPRHTYEASFREKLRKTFQNVFHPTRLVYVGGLLLCFA